MNERNTKLIQRKFVHKSKEENVLIYFLRRALPRKIDAAVLENIILPALSLDEQIFLKKYYTKESFVFLLERKSEEKPYYILHSLPHEISIDFCMEFLKLIRIPREKKRLLLRYFKRDLLTEHFILKDGITEKEELEILGIIGLKDWHISDEQKAELSRILEKFNHDLLPKDEIYYCNMHVPLNHVFFFEHSAEHVPGIMIIEAVRQFSIACCHLYGKVPFKDVSFLLSGMQCNFQHFLDLNYPIKFRCVNRSTMKKRFGHWVDIDMHIFVYQKNKEMANFPISAKCVPKNSFQIFRSEPVLIEKLPRFKPIHSFIHNLTIRDPHKKKYLCDLIDLSYLGFRIRFADKTLKTDSIGNQFEFFIFFQDVGFVHGDCIRVWNSIIDEEIYAGFRITFIQESDMESLKEAIRTMCYIREEREIL